MAGRLTQCGRVSGAALCALAVLLAAPHGARATLRYVGFNNHLFTDRTADLTKTLARERAAGANVQRLDIDWNLIEVAGPGEYSPPSVDRLDRIVDATYAHHRMRTLLTVGATPCWASSTPFKLGGQCLASPGPPYGDYPPRNPRDFGDFVGWLTSRYGSKLAGVEVGNEANAGLTIFDERAKAAQYAQLVEAAHLGRTDQVPIVAGALASGADQDLGFMDALFSQPGFAHSFDIWSFHSYASSAAGSTEAVRRRQRKLEANGVGVPIWVDEFGASTCTRGPRCAGKITNARQAALLTTTFGALNRIGPGVSGAISYDFRDDGPDPSEPEQNFGIVTNDYAKKNPSYDAVAGCLKSLHPRSAHRRRSQRRHRRRRPAPVRCGGSG